MKVFETLFKRESDSVNFEEGTFLWNGQTFNMGDGRLMRSRFVRYLESPSDGFNTRVYIAILQEIESRLSVRSRQGGGDAKDSNLEPTIAAWKLLFQAGDHPIDGGNSLVLANLVYDNWRERKAFQSADFRRAVSLGELERMEDRLTSYGDTVVMQAKRDLERQSRERPNAANTLEMRRLNAAAKAAGEEGTAGQGETASQGASEALELPGSVASTSMLPTGTGSALIRELILEQFEQESLGLELAEIGVRARLKMQSQIVAFLAQRRFDHAVLGSSFFRILFKGGAQDLRVDQAMIQKVLPEFQLPPTVDQLEFVARQALDDVSKTMLSVENAFDGGRRLAALERLQEAFFLGEYTLPVIAFPEEKRAVLRDLYYDLRDARRVADLKDYETLEELVARIESLASDFPALEVRSQIRLAKRASEMKLLSARAAMGMQQMELARSELDAAFAIWPLNPALQTFMAGAVGGTNLAADFDRDYANRSFREIFNRRQEYLPVLANDPERGRLMEEVLEVVQGANFAIRAAEAQAAQRNYYGAWELLAEAVEVLPDDRELNSALTRMTGEVAEYVSLLRQAERMARDGYFAASLNFYLQARDQYPLSTKSADGVTRIANSILDQVAVLEQRESSAPDGAED